MDRYERDFKIDDMKSESLDQITWKLFVQKFGKEAYLWLCKEINGGKIYVPELDRQLKASRMRANKKLREIR